MDNKQSQQVLKLQSANAVTAEGSHPQAPPFQGGERMTYSAASKAFFPSNPKLSKVFAFIEANYHQSVTLSNVAQAVGYSKSYLTNLVKNQTGKTVNRWIAERRLAAARSLLLETDQAVEQIAHAVGYLHLGYFFRQFRQHHGTTPSSWRKAQRTRSQTKLN